MICSAHVYVDQDLRLLAGVTNPANVTDAEYSHISSNVGQTLPSLDCTEVRATVVPAGSFIPVGPVGPDGPVGMTSLSELTIPESVILKTDSVGPVGPSVTSGLVGSYGTLSPCDFAIYPDQPVADGPVGLSVTLGPVGPYGMLSRCNSDKPVADGPVGPYVALSPVGSYGMLSRCDPDQLVADGPVGPSVTFGPVGPHVEFGPVGPYETLFRREFDQHDAVGPSTECSPVGSNEMQSSNICDYDAVLTMFNW